MKNKDIAEQLKKEILGNKEVEMSIRATAVGDIKVFLRNNECQKLIYKAVEIDSVSFENDTWDGIELPANVYRRFCILLCDMVAELQDNLDYGHLICQWEFKNEEGTDEWDNYCKLRFDRETHFAKTQKVRYTQ